MHIEADLDPVHFQRLNELRARMNRPIVEILNEAIDMLYRKETPVVADEDAIVRRLKARFAHLPPGVSLADELIAERRQEASRENAP
jgi:hypothetical protein